MKNKILLNHQFQRIPKKLMVTIILGIFLISGVSALDTQGIGKEGQNFTFIQTCDTATYITLSTIQKPDRSVQVINANMTSTGGGAFQYNLTSLVSGRYDLTGISDGCEKTFATYIEITYNGVELKQSQSTIYIPLFLFLIFIFIITILGIKQLPSSNTQDEEGKILSISYLKYLRPVGWFFLWILFIAMLFLSSNIAFAFLGEQLFAKILFVLFRICFGLTPVIVIVWIIWIYRQMFHDKQMQKMLNRGIFPEGKL